jgi:DnaD/phage-associated family protein
MPSVRYIEKAAYTWVREGILTLDSADEYLKALEERKSARGEIKAALQIRDRELSASEKQYIDGWIALGFGADAVGVAYDRTVLKTGKLAWGYMDSIMRNWHGKGVHTPEEISEKDGKPGGSAANNNQKSSAPKFGAANQEEFERMQQVLQKIKGN